MGKKKAQAPTLPRIRYNVLGAPAKALYYYWYILPQNRLFKKKC